jgi:cytochrome c-type biogenesis protein CcmH/NrfF
MTKSRTRLVGLAMVALCASSITTTVLRAEVQPSERTKQVGGKFMCMCGCNQVLKEVDDGLANGGSEATVTQALVQEFGTKVYAEPPKSGLSLVAWSLPGAYLALGTALVIFVIFRWRARPVPQAAVAGMSAGISPADLEKARQRVSRDTQD